MNAYRDHPDTLQKMQLESELAQARRELAQARREVEVLRVKLACSEQENSELKNRWNA